MRRIPDPPEFGLAWEGETVLTVPQRVLLVLKEADRTSWGLEEVVKRAADAIRAGNVPSAAVDVGLAIEMIATQRTRFYRSQQMLHDLLGEEEAASE